MKTFKETYEASRGNMLNNSNPHIPQEAIKNSDPLETQVGGTHYINCKIQPVEYITVNKLNFLEGCIVKRITRHRNKAKDEDIRKIIHEAKLILRLEYNYSEQELREL